MLVEFGLREEVSAKFNDFPSPIVNLVQIMLLNCPVFLRPSVKIASTILWIIYL